MNDQGIRRVTARETVQRRYDLNEMIRYVSEQAALGRCYLEDSAWGDIVFSFRRAMQEERKAGANQGFEEGRVVGYDAGHRAGYEDGVEDSE